MPCLRGAASRASGLRRLPFLERKGSEKSFHTALYSGSHESLSHGNRVPACGTFQVPHGVFYAIFKAAWAANRRGRRLPAGLPASAARPPHPPDMHPVGADLCVRSSPAPTAPPSRSLTLSPPLQRRRTELAQIHNLPMIRMVTHHKRLRKRPGDIQHNALLLRLC